MDLQLSAPFQIKTEIKVKPPVFKLPECPKKLEFLSNIGKKRLIRICEDNNLNDEIIFTGGWVGPSESFVKEQVSDFVQHYFFRRARRLSIDRQAYLNTQLLSNLQEIQRNNSFQRRPLVFTEYEKYVNERNESIDCERKAQEIERLSKMLISGDIKSAPTSFEWIKNDPIFRMNRVMDQIRELEKTKIQIKPMPFKLRYLKPIKNLKERFSTRDQPVLNLKLKNNESPYKIPVVEEIDQHELISTPKSVYSEQDSTSSGFQEITPSPIPLTQKVNELRQVALSQEGYYFNSPQNDQERNNSTGLDIDISFSDMSDEELSICAEKYFPKEDFSGDLEIHLNSFFQSEPVRLVKRDLSCQQMYELGSKVVDMYERQEVTGIEFLEKLSSKHFGK